MEFDDNSIDYIKHRNRIEGVYLRRRVQSFQLLLAMIVLLTIVFVVVQLVPTYQSLLSRQEQILAAQLEGMKKIPDIEKKLSNIENKMALLTTESIESRLVKIENAINAGSIKTEDVKSFVNLKSDFDVMKSYMFKDPKELVELKELQKNYSVLSQAQSAFATKETVRSEIATLQTILTVSLTFFGILFTVLFGSWWFVGKRNNPQVQPTRPAHKSSQEPKESAEGGQ